MDNVSNSEFLSTVDELLDMEEGGSRQLEIPEALAGERLDKVLAQLMPEFSRNRIQGWIEAGYVTSHGQILKVRHRSQAGELIQVEIQPEPEELAYLPEDIPLDIVFEDEDLLIINKPAGMVVHPAAGNWQGTLLNALLHHYPKIAEVPRCGIVHRLDKETSGLLMVAKTIEAQLDLVRQLEARRVVRRYFALAWGLVKPQTIDAPIGRDPKDRLKMGIVRGQQGKVAITHIKRLAQVDLADKTITAIQVQLETGRTHQIRVHLESIGHPLLGDLVYRKRIPAVAAKLEFSRAGQALHALVLGIIHPRTQKPMLWQAPLPTDMSDLVQHLGFSPNVAHVDLESLDVE